MFENISGVATLFPMLNRSHDLMTNHPVADVFDDYALGTLPEPALARFEEHLLICGPCQDRLAAVDVLRAAVCLSESKDVRTKRLDFSHDTEDGMIVSEVHRVGRGKWLARHYGPQLDGGKLTKTLREANTYLLESFKLMFPEHVCTLRCQPVQKKGPSSPNS
jgi:hypothetical protein